MSKSALKKILDRKMLIVFLLGISSGLPFLMVSGTLKLWLTREGIEIATIGYFGWVGLAYSLKFFWAPFMDRFTLFSLGRRRSWILTSQIILAALVFTLGTMSPHVNLMNMAIVSALIAFFSATQDIAIDAYRRELCDDDEVALGTTFANYGIRLAMLITGGLGVGLVQGSFTWNHLYYLVAALLALSTLITLSVPEPPREPLDTLPDGKPEPLMMSLLRPFREFLSRDGALFALLFIFLFKLGDALAGAMLGPFYVQMGYSNEVIAFVAKTVGLGASLLGLFIGGVTILKLGIYRSLWFFGVLQALSTFGFSLITVTGPQTWALGVAVVFEDISAGMGSAAFVAFISLLCNRRYTATQFATLASIATLGRNFFSGFSGLMVEQLGWPAFFTVCALIAIPGMIMLIPMRRYQANELS